ncbi:hypothetical protein BDR26DRAFT_862254 [Obelidium mucronatum]|nr:hypothetical protein BDR26DRAFT_862254 [Obelidium mucronatum]
MKSKCRFRKIKEDSDSEKGCFWSLNPNEPFLRESIDNAWETVLKLESWPGIAYYRLSPEECSSEAPLLPPTLFSEDSKRFYNDLYMFDEFGGFGKFSVIDAAGTASGSLSSSSAAFALRQIPHGYIHGFLPLPPPPFHNTTVATGGDVLCTGATALTIGNAGSGPEKASKSALKHIQKLASSLSALSSSTSRPFESQSSVLHERSGLVPLMRSASDSQVFATTQFRSDGQCGLAGAWPSSDDDSDGDMDDHDMDESDSNFGSHEASQSRFFSRSSSNSQLLPSHSSRQPFSQEQQHYANRPENNNWMEFVYSSSNSHHHSSHNCQKHQHQNNVHYSHLGCKIMAACGGYMTPVTSTVTTTATTSSSSSEYMFDLFNEGTEAAETEPSLLFGSPEQNSDKFFSATPLIHMSSVDIERLIADPSVSATMGDSEPSGFLFL